jgi:aminoglycoside phosphotransferase (APT) family kinase protein
VPGIRCRGRCRPGVPGTVASETNAGALFAFAQDLATFIEALRSVDTSGARFEGPNRGGELRRHDEWMETCFRHSEGLLDVPRLRELWRGFRELPRLAPDV